VRRRNAVRRTRRGNGGERWRIVRRRRLTGLFAKSSAEGMTRTEKERDGVVRMKKARGDETMSLNGSGKPAGGRRTNAGGSEERRKPVNGNGERKRSGGRRVEHESDANWRRNASGCGRMLSESGLGRLPSGNVGHRSGGSMLKRPQRGWQTALLVRVIP